MIAPIRHHFFTRRRIVATCIQGRSYGECGVATLSQYLDCRHTCRKSIVLVNAVLLTKLKEIPIYRQIGAPLLLRLFMTSSTYAVEIFRREAAAVSLTIPLFSLSNLLRFSATCLSSWNDALCSVKVVDIKT